MKRLICAAAVVALATPLTAQDKAADVMAEARKALGAEKLAQLKTLSLEGPFGRDMGGRRVEGKIALTMQMPDRMHRLEDTEFMGGMSMERTSVLAGNTSWEDMQNRGGPGGGGQMIFRTAGPGGQELNAQQVEEARLRRMRTEFNRYLLAFFGGSTLQPTYVAVAEAPEGKADVVEVKNEAGQAVRLFIDQATHMPLMLQYQEVRAMINMMGGPGGRGGPGGGPGFRAGDGGGGGGGGRRMDGPPPAGGSPTGGAPPAGAPGTAGAGSGAPVVTGPGTGTGTGGGTGGGRGEGQRPTPEEIQKRMASMPPPAPVTVTLFLGEFKKVDGVMLPHRLTQAIDGKTVEEWTIEKVKVNPSVKADLFEKK